MTNDDSICRLFVKQAGTNLKKIFSSYGNVKSVYEMRIAADNMYFGCQWNITYCSVAYGCYVCWVLFLQLYLYVTFLVLLFFLFLLAVI